MVRLSESCSGCNNPPKKYQFNALKILAFKFTKPTHEMP